MKTATLRFSPRDHGKTVTPDVLAGAGYVPGFKYEIIDGRLYVSPVPNLPENRLEHWLRRAVERYADDRPDVINYVTTKGRVLLPDSDGLTVPEPDIAAYRDYPSSAAYDAVSWDDISPVWVAEILVEGDFEKDLSRNPRLYLAVPSIREYWVLDGSEDPNRPTLIRHVRKRGRWAVETRLPGGSVETPIFPGFKLIIDPRQR